MGLKITKYNLPVPEIEVSPAYLQIISVTADIDGNAKLFAVVQKSRDSIKTTPYQTIEMNFTADKSLPLFEQGYEFLKENGFSDWEDDIVPIEPVIPDIPVEVSEKSDIINGGEL